MAQKRPPPKFLMIAPKYFDRSEHYKSGDRATIWIKLHLDFLDDFEFCELPDSVKYHFIGLLMFAVKNGNRFPNNPQFLANKIGAKEELCLEILLQNGYITPAKRMKTNTELASTEQEQEQEEDLEEKQQQGSGGNLSEFSYEENIEFYTHRKQIDPTIRSIEALAKTNLKSGKYDPDIRVWMNEQKVEAEKAAKEAENNEFRQWAKSIALKVGENRDLSVENLIEKFGLMPTHLQRNFNKTKEQFLYMEFMKAGTRTQTAMDYLSQLSTQINGATPMHAPDEAFILPPDFFKLKKGKK